MKVIKRNGSEVVFDITKIITAITKANERKNYFKETLKSLRESEDVRVFDTYVKVDSAIEWSQDNSKPVVAYKKYSRSAIEYRSLAKEIVEYANR